MLYAQTILENETHKLISATWPDLVIVNKNRELAELWNLLYWQITEWNWRKAKRYKYLDFASELKIPMEHESEVGALGTITKATGRIENNSTGGDHPNGSTDKIGQNTEKSTGDMRRLAVTQTPVKDHQLMLVRKTLKGLK